MKVCKHNSLLKVIHFKSCSIFQPECQLVYRSPPAVEVILCKVVQASRMGAAISSAEAGALKQSWGQLKPTADKVAVDAFAKLFKAEPKYQDKFVRLRGVPAEEMPTNKVLYTHGKLFASTVGIMAKHADDKEIMNECVEKLAMRHLGMNLKESDFQKACDTYVGCMPQDIDKEVWKKAAKALNPQIVKRMAEMK